MFNKFFDRMTPPQNRDDCWTWVRVAQTPSAPAGRVVFITFNEEQNSKGLNNNPTRILFDPGMRRSTNWGCHQGAVGGHVEIHCVLQQLFRELFPVLHLRGARDGFLPAEMACSEQRPRGFSTCVVTDTGFIVDTVSL